MRLSPFACIAATLLLGACASTQPVAKPAAFASARTQKTMPQKLATAMPAGMLTQAPNGYDALCGDSPRLCGLETVSYNASDAVADTGESDTSADPAALMQTLNRVNRAVNAEVYPVSAQLVGSSPWSRPIAQNGLMMGDCKNYAVEKRERLLAAGFPAHDLYYAIAYRRDVGLHAVLVAKVDGRDLVLDNRSPWIVPWTEAPYIWVKRQSVENPKIWRLAIADDRVRTVQTASLAVADESRLP